MTDGLSYVSLFRDFSAGSAQQKTSMNLARHSRQLFPLILGNSRTAFAMCNQTFSTSKIFSKEEDAIKLRENPFYHKYAEKIERLKKTNPEEYHKRIKLVQDGTGDRETTEKKNDMKVQKEGRKEHKSDTTKKVLKDGAKKRGLDAIMRLELLQDKTSAEITEIWKNYYKERDAVFAVIPASSYKALRELTERLPMFIYPLPRQDGYEMFLGQFSGNDCHFTSLVQYHKHGAHAPVQLVINHYTELRDSKGIVLMSGSTVDEGVSVTDAQLLSYQIQYFYNEDNYQLVKDFNSSPQTFDYNKVIECIGNSLLQRQNEIRKK